MATKIVFTEGGMSIHGLDRGENFSLNPTDDTVAMDAEIIERTFYDTIFDDSISAGDDTNVDLGPTDSSLCAGVTFESLNPELFTVDANGYVTMGNDVSGGTERGEVRARSLCAGEKTVSIQRRSGRTRISKTVTGFVANTLAAYVREAIDAMIEGTSAGDTYQLYYSTNNSNVSAPAVTLNANRFTKDLDLSGISAMGDNQPTLGEIVPITLISNRHGIASIHVNWSVGDAVVFFSPDASSYETVVISAITEVPVDTDLEIIYFDSAITVSNPFKVMPYRWTHIYTPSTTEDTNGLPVGACSLPMIRKMMHDLVPTGPTDYASYVQLCALSVHYTATSKFNLDFSLAPQLPNHVDYFHAWLQGDSSSPVFIPIYGDAVLVTLGGQISVFGETGTCIGCYIDEINLIMNDQAGTVDDYALVHPDLSAFTTYE